MNRDALKERVVAGGVPFALVSPPVSQEPLSGITIRVRGLDDGEHAIALEHDAKLLDFPEFEGKVRVDGTLIRSGERISIRAVASSKGDFECTRCAEPFERLIKADLELEFVPPRLEGDPEDPNIHVFEPLSIPFIDITQDVRDALALSIPMRHLCRPNCKGLCLVCGADLNRETCAHQSDIEKEEEAPAVSQHWSALKGLQERLRAEEENGHGIRPLRRGAGEDGG